MRTLTWWTLAFAIVLVTSAPRTQQGEATNPFQGNAQAIGQGLQLFRSSCASCHGLNAKGGDPISRPVNGHAAEPTRSCSGPSCRAFPERHARRAERRCHAGSGSGPLSHICEH